MTKRKKRLQLFYCLNQDATFSFIKKILEDYDYQLYKITGSHFKFRKQDLPVLTIPSHNNIVKKCYIKDLQKILKKINHLS